MKRPGKRASNIPKIGCVQHDCAACRSLKKRLAVVVRSLQNAEPLMRGFTPGPVALAHQNVVEALGALNVAASTPNAFPLQKETS